MPSLHTIPTVDISPYLSSDASQEALDDVVDAVRHACTTYGFFQLVGHGVPVEDQERILECTKAFFELPLEERNELWIGNSLGKSNRGYEPSGIQTHQKGLLADTKEAFVIGAEVPRDDPDAGSFSMGPNLWPKSLPKEEFEIPIMEYRAKILKVVEVLLKILALGLPSDWGCSPDVFDEFTVKPSTPMRLLHYPPQAKRDERQFGVGDHTDFGGITVLLQQPGTVGLEVWYPPTETWIPVPVKDNTFVINIGDMLQKWTGGYYRSARHRVISSTDKHRFSVPFFLNGNMKLKIVSLDGSGVETTVGEHIKKRFVETLGPENAKFLD